MIKKRLRQRIECSQCGRAVTISALSQGETRRIAQDKRGWVQENGEDICPGCKHGEKENTARAAGTDADGKQKGVATII